MFEVVGGTYRELVVDPYADRHLGSGLRAARFLGPSIARFHTSVGVGEHSARSTLQSLLGDRWIAEERPAPVTFRYRTPVSTSEAFGATRSPLPRMVEITDGADAVVFGMVEHPLRVRGARRLVIDPQGSLTFDDLADQLADELCVVLNRAELEGLTSASDLRAGAEELRERLDATVVVVKCGAHGAYAIDRSGEVFVAPVVSRSVWAVGTGDVFTTAFAQAWAGGAATSEALTAASAATAVESEAAHPTPWPEAAPTIEWAAGPHTVDRPPTIYLAGSFETTSQRWLLNETRSALRSIGMQPFSPFHDVGVVGDDPAAHVAQDLEAVRRADAVLVLSDIAGRGTFVEAGVAVAADVPVVVLAERLADWQHTVLRGAGAWFCRDLSTCVYHAAWTALQAAHPT